MGPTSSITLFLIKRKGSPHRSKTLSTSTFSCTKALLKDPPPGHPERAMTEKALEIMGGVATHVNVYNSGDKMRKKIDESIPPNVPPRCPTVAEKQGRSFSWFAGLMTRHTAAEKLQHQPDGTFLVRESDNAKGSLVLSVIYHGEDKHMKIVCNGRNLYSLTNRVHFKTIPELIENYKRNTLGASFPSLPTTLTRSIRDVVIVRHEFNARNHRELSLRQDARVVVLKRQGNWWYGELDGNFGFFPKNYVEEVSTAS